VIGSGKKKPMHSLLRRTFVHVLAKKGGTLPKNKYTFCDTKVVFSNKEKIFFLVSIETNTINLNPSLPKKKTKKTCNACPYL